MKCHFQCYISCFIENVSGKPRWNKPGGVYQTSFHKKGFKRIMKAYSWYFKRSLFLVPPILVYILVLPPVMGLTSTAFSSKQLVSNLLVVAPFWIGLLSVPGYIYAVFVKIPFVNVSIVMRWWVIASLTIGALASVGGAIIGLIMPLITFLSIISFFCITLLFSEGWMLKK